MFIYNNHQDPSRGRHRHMITMYISKPQTLYIGVSLRVRRRVVDRSDRHRHPPYGHTVYPCTSSHVCTRRPRSRAHIPRRDAMYAKASPHRISTDHIAARRSRARSMMGVRCARVWNTQVGFPTDGDGVVCRRASSHVVVRRHTSVVDAERVRTANAPDRTEANAS